MQLNDWLSRLERLHFKSIDMGLERIQAVARRLNLTTDTPFIFSIAGTNGKGSTTALIDTALRAAGYRTGVYTSPHILRFNERICIAGEPCTDEALIQAFEAVEAGRGDISLTYFEFTTLAAAWLFKQQNLDAWVLEVGLGGRLDAVNIWDAGVAVVTSIDLDHQAFLGNSRESVGKEKIGIGRQGKPLIVGEPDVPPVVREQAKGLGVHWAQQGIDFGFDAGENDWAWWSTQHGRVDAQPLPSIYLQNAATALQALHASPFTVPPQTLQTALQTVAVLGRRQLIAQAPAVMLDVGHNPHAARALAAYIASQNYRRVHCVVGMLGDKDITDTLLALAPAVDRWYPVPLDSDRALPVSQLHQTLQEMGGLSVMTGYHAGITCTQLRKQVEPEDLILVFGSFYTVADALQNHLS